MFLHFQIKSINRDKGEVIEKTKRCGGYELYPVTINHVVCSEINIDNVRTEHYSSLFRCNANNSYGTDAVYFKIVRPGSPERPTLVTAENVTDTSMEIVWRPGFNGGSKQVFFLQVKETESGHEKYKLKKTKDIRETFTIISGLQPNMKYTIRVKGRNRHGTSTFSDEIQVRTQRKLHVCGESRFFMQIIDKQNNRQIYLILNFFSTT